MGKIRYIAGIVPMASSSGISALESPIIAPEPNISNPQYDDLKKPSEQPESHEYPRYSRLIRSTGDLKTHQMRKDCRNDPPEAFIEPQAAPPDIDLSVIWHCPRCKDEFWGKSARGTAKAYCIINIDAADGVCLRCAKVGRACTWKTGPVEGCVAVNGRASYSSQESRSSSAAQLNMAANTLGSTNNPIVHQSPSYYKEHDRKC
ncbi:hypothetical protein CC78DRAFT_539317 [Lojkania enalia]|uniref:Uncharacterized protein n=1 Tax=Lojkania enalia TaxID=147567 RepID=A0A9P4TQD6_9PLEO|nr:hypothetical protein CC78DRAFT_539317 [Didymosphaeria enalia]